MVREVLREHHVDAALEDAQLPLERARRPAEVRRRAHVEHDLARRVDPQCQRVERPQRPADAAVDRQPAADQQPICDSGGSGEPTHPRPPATMVETLQP